MTKDELKQEAARLGVKVKEGWMDDWKENTVIAVVFFAIGIAAQKVFHFL